VSRAVLGFALAFLMASAPVRADLQDDVARLEAAWATSSVVTRFPPHVEERGSLHLLLLPSALTDPTTPECTTVAVLSAIGTSFVLRFLPQADAPPRFAFDEQPVVSEAGAAVLTRCGAHKAALARLTVDLRSPRAVVQTLVARGPSLLPPLERVLPYRDPGPSEYFNTAGVPPAPAPLADRIRLLERQARRDGATGIEERTLHADTSGLGQLSLALAAGCHRISLLDSGPKAGARGGADVDFELVRPESGDVVASDRSASADASTLLCVGEATTLKLEFGGATPERPLVLVDASRPLPRELPTRWGADARAAIAGALWRRHVRSLPSSPVYESLGVMGDTLLPVALEPDACYLLATAAMRETGTRLSVSVDAGPRQYADRGGTAQPAAAVAFCAQGARRALIDVQADGAGTVWLLSLWQTSRSRLGALQL
jgi:hypothetical protein